jgi:dipeptidyl aminopeptidase/acylaminoacyl peptidase
MSLQYLTFHFASTTKSINMRKLLALLAVISFCLHTTAQKDRITVTDMLKIKSISTVNLNKEGSQAVIGVTAIEPDNDSKLEYKYVNQLWLVATDGSVPARQISGKENASAGMFSPDGNSIVFLRAVDGKAQVFSINLNGGEAQQVTHSKYSLGAPRFSRDGRKMIVSASVPLKDLVNDTLFNASHQLPAWSFERPGLSNAAALIRSTATPNPDGSLAEVRAYLDNNVTDKKAKVITRLNFQDETDVTTDRNLTQFFVINTSSPDRLIPVSHGFYNYNAAEFTPDGKSIVIIAGYDSTMSEERALETQLLITDSLGNNARVIAGGKGKSFQGLKISPSGKWIACLVGTTSFVNVPELQLLPISGDEAQGFKVPLDRNKSGLAFTEDERYLFCTAQSNGGSPLYRVNLKTKSVEQLSDVNSGVLNFAVGGNRVVFAKTEVKDPFELFAGDLGLKNVRQLTNLNTDWLNTKTLSTPEKKTFTNDLGQTIEYWVMKPIGFSAGTKYPVVLDIHGGPSAMWGPGETSMWHEFQYFCSKGYGVVYCNPRGSGGYGTEFLRANINNWGKGPTSDVLTALDKAVGEGWIDTAHQFVTGGSYAGYLVAWIIAHDHRFKAACSQRGVYDLPTFFGEGNAWRLVPNYFGGYPWEPAAKANLERESPINYVDQITTPYLIFHGDNDRRTGFVQSEMLYRSLKVLNRPVEYVRHPAATHELTRSGNNRQRIDQMLRTWEFFERYRQ